MYPSDVCTSPTFVSVRLFYQSSPTFLSLTFVLVPSLYGKLLYYFGYFEVFRHQKVSIFCSEKELKLGTGSVGQEWLTGLCSVTGFPFPVMNKGKRIDNVGKKYVQVIPACWKAEKVTKEVPSVNQITEVVERKLWAGKKVVIPAGSAKLVRIETEEGWQGEGFIESMPPEEPGAGQRLVLSETTTIRKCASASHQYGEPL